jgi:O-acetyl-ADP-ribose deacetylase (regulator of RNase III)
MRLGESTTGESLRAAMRNSLRRVNENEIRTIAFQAIGTGIAAFPLEECARIMLDEIRSHLLGETTLEHVEIVLFDASALAAFARVFATLPT